MELEKLNIGINWVQTFGMVLAIEVALPESFKEFFSFLEIFSFNFEIFEGMSDAVSIAMGLLVPPWLVFEFDVGLFFRFLEEEESAVPELHELALKRYRRLFRERTYLGFLVYGRFWENSSSRA